MRRRSAAIGAPTSARCRGTSCRRCARPAGAIPCSCSTRSTSSRRATRAIRSRRCSRCSIRSRTTRSATTISACPSICRRCCSSAPPTCSTPFPAPLRDRMEIIELTGYTEEEKLQIARRYLLARQLKANGLTADQVKISDEALRRVIVDYTREAGVQKSRAPDRRPAAQRRGVDRLRARHAACRSTPTTVAAILGAAALRERRGAAHQRARASPPASPGRRRAATSCSSSRAACEAAAS